MSSLKIPSWVAVILLGVILILWLRWPDGELSESEKKQYKTAIAILEAEKAEIQSMQNDQQKMVKDTIEAYNVQLRAQKEQTAYWKEKSKERRVIVKERIESDPDVLRFVQSQDSVIISLEAENLTLERKALFNAQVYKDLIAMEIQEDRADSLMHWQSQQRIAGLEKDVRKQKRKTVGAVVIGVAATVGALLLAK